MRKVYRREDEIARKGESGQRDYRDTPVFADLDDGETPRPARRSPSPPAPLSSQQKLSDNQNLRYSLSMPCYEPKMPPMRVLAFLPTANPAQPRGDGRDSGPVEPRAPRWPLTRAKPLTSHGVSLRRQALGLTKLDEA
jgi:hypothetical protein